MLLRATVTIALLAVTTPTAQAAQPTQWLRVNGATATSSAGAVVDGAGDVNGDGRPDLVVGAPADGPAGSAYVVFGPAQPGTVELSQLGANGFRIDGAQAGAATGLAVSGGGDVNGDGLDDVIVAAPEAKGGRVYVVFGKRDNAPVALGALRAGGYRIHGPTSRVRDAFGTKVDSAGDVNGDGLSDLVASKPGGAGEEGGGTTGQAYVVYGSRSTTSVATRRLGARGFRIDVGQEPADVAGLGDVNGDRRPDVAIGVPNAYRRLGSSVNVGAAFVVFGRRYREPVVAQRLVRRRGYRYTLGRDGFRVLGRLQSGQAGTSVAGGGDVNGDGLRDVIVGAPDGGLGNTWVIFGRRAPGTVDLRSLGNRGIRITGTLDWIGYDVAGPGDLNADGRDDVLTTAGYSLHGVFGTAATAPVDVASDAYVADGSAVAPGRCPWQRGYSTVAAVGDVDGDGRADAVAGAPCAGAPAAPAGQERPGRGAVVVFRSP